MANSNNTSKPTWESKINWTQIVSVAAMGATMFGFDIEPDLQERLAVTISSLAAAATIVWRTWFTNARLR